MHKEAPKLLRLDEAELYRYRHSNGAAVKLRFGRRFVYVHLATQAVLDYWTSQVGTYHWVRGEWRVMYNCREARVYYLAEQQPV